MVVVDASLVLKLVLAEEDSEEAANLWRRWAEEGEVVAAPPLFSAETSSVLRRRVYQGKLDPAQGDAAFAVLRGLVVDILEPVDLYPRAWDLAKELNQPTTYDCCYLALAELLVCELWTADERLHRAAEGRFPWLRPLNAYRPE